MNLGDRIARCVTDFVSAMNGNDNNYRHEQPKRPQGGGKHAGTGRDERR